MRYAVKCWGRGDCDGVPVTRGHARYTCASDAASWVICCGLTGQYADACGPAGLAHDDDKPSCITAIPRGRLARKWDARAKPRRTTKAARGSSGEARAAALAINRCQRAHALRSHHTHRAARKLDASRQARRQETMVGSRVGSARRAMWRLSSTRCKPFPGPADPAPIRRQARPPTRRSILRHRTDVIGAGVAACARGADPTALAARVTFRRTADTQSDHLSSGPNAPRRHPRAPGTR